MQGVSSLLDTFSVSACWQALRIFSEDQVSGERRDLPRLGETKTTIVGDAAQAALPYTITIDTLTIRNH